MPKARSWAANFSARRRSCSASRAVVRRVRAPVRPRAGRSSWTGSNPETLPPLASYTPGRDAQRQYIIAGRQRELSSAASSMARRAYRTNSPKRRSTQDRGRRAERRPGRASRHCVTSGRASRLEARNEQKYFHRPGWRDAARPNAGHAGLARVLYSRPHPDRLAGRSF